MTPEDRGHLGSLEQVGVAEADRVATPPLPPKTSVRGAFTALGLVALALSAIFGSDLFGVRERLLGSATPEPRPAAVNRTADGSAAAPPSTVEETVLRSQPWWQSLAVLEGTGRTTPPPFSVDDGAIQWRVRWTCESGKLAVQATGSGPLVDASCPGTGTDYSTETSDMSLQVEAEGPWKLQVDQQIDVPLVEPPLPSMTAPGTVKESTGTFYRLDQSTTGSVTIFRSGEGTRALRLDDFFVTPNVELEIRLSPLEAPQTTQEFMEAPSAWVAPLDVTAGSMNFAVPDDVDPTQFKSVVIWCPLIDSAYAAATLTPGQ